MMMNKWITILLLLLFTNQIFGQNKCIGDTLMLWVDSNPTWQYKWFIEPDLSFNGQSSPTIRIDSLPERIKINIEITNHYGCVGEAELTLYAEDCGWSIYFPTAIVPDGVNTSWFPKFYNVIIRELYIYDRFGNIQWTWVNEEFFGINNNGSELPSGVYTFICFYSPQGKKVRYEKIDKIVIIR